MTAQRIERAENLEAVPPHGEEGASRDAAAAGEAPRPSGVQVIDRMFDILEQLADARGPLGLGELTRATSLSKSTVRRILQAMEGRGYVRRCENGGYTVGPQLFETTGRHINSLELQTEAQPYLATLKGELGLIAYLGVLDGTWASYIGKEAMALRERIYTPVGFRTPAYCSSIGKCLLACLGRAELEATLYETRFEALTPRTIVEPKALVEELRRIRAQGWAIDDEEFELGHRCVAAPVYDYRGEAIAAVGVSGTTENIEDARLPLVARSVVEAAGQISRCMGYVG